MDPRPAAPDSAMAIYEALHKTGQYVRVVGEDGDHVPADDELRSVWIDGEFDLHAIAAAIGTPPSEEGARPGPMFWCDAHNAGMGGCECPA